MIRAKSGNESGTAWDNLWKHLHTLFTTSKAVQYFTKTLGLFVWQNQPIAPGLMFGPLKKIDAQELKTALATLTTFLDDADTAIRSKYADKEWDAERYLLAKKLHGCDLDSGAFMSLQLAQLFAYLFKVFVKSVDAGFICQMRYMICLKMARSKAAARYIDWELELQKIGAPENLHWLLRSGKVELLPFSLEGHDWNGNYDSKLDVQLAVTLDVMKSHDFQLIPLQYTHWWWKSSESAFASDVCGPYPVADIFLTMNNANNAAKSLFTRCFPTNFTVLFGEQGDTSVPVHDWILASVFPYFETLLASGLGETRERQLFLPESFSLEVFLAILVSVTGNDCRTASGKSFYITRLEPTDFAQGEEPLEEFGILFSPPRGKSKPETPQSLPRVACSKAPEGYWGTESYDSPCDDASSCGGCASSSSSSDDSPCPPRGRCPTVRAAQPSRHPTISHRRRRPSSKTRRRRSRSR